MTSTHICPAPQNGIYHSGYRTKAVYALPCVLHAPPISFHHPTASLEYLSVCIVEADCVVITRLYFQHKMGTKIAVPEMALNTHHFPSVRLSAQGITCPQNASHNVLGE
jgi:hypothetical protein